MIVYLSLERSARLCNGYCAGLSTERGRGFKSPTGQPLGSRFLPHLIWANSAIKSTMTVHCRWEDETAMERTVHGQTYAGTKKMRSLTLHTHDCLSGCVFIKQSKFEALPFHTKFNHV